MKMNVNQYLRFGLAVALSCCTPLAEDASEQDAAAYIAEALRVFFSNTDTHVDVATVSHPQSSKIPLIITIDDEQRLLWFYPQMSLENLTKELEGLVSDCIAPIPCVPA